MDMTLLDTTPRDRPATVPMSVIVVDDDAASRDALRKVVESLGYTCRTACDGEEALQLLERAPADAIIGDGCMPRMDGLTLCRIVRSRGERYVYFMLVTAMNDKQFRVDAMRAGADDYLTKPVDVDELSARLLCAQRVVNLHRALSARSSALRRDSERNFRIARVDPLTGAHNRLALTEDLRAAREQLRRYGPRCAIAMCDVDKFKAYNDMFGHLAGDEALKSIVHTMRTQLRNGDGVYRFGGEEFVIVLPHQDLTSARCAMERVRVAVASSKLSTGRVTISIGVGELHADDDDSSCMKRVDTALYKAKLGGRNRVEE